jgi:hypothetical protein
MGDPEPAEVEPTDPRPTLPRTVKEIREAIPALDDKYILDLLRIERGKEKPRKTAIEALEAEMERRDQ